MWDFARCSHRLRWWIAYHLRWPSRSAFVCELIGHRPVTAVDNTDGFDMVWCTRCNEVLRG